LLASAVVFSLLVWACCACGVYNLCWVDYLGRKPVYEPGKFDDAEPDYALKEIYEGEEKPKKKEIELPPVKGEDADA